MRKKTMSLSSYPKPSINDENLRKILLELKKVADK